MRRRSRAGGEPVKARRRKTATRKRRNAPKAVRPRSSSAASKETKVARLIRERDEAFQQQTATAEVLKVISRSTFDLPKVLNTLVESAARLCEADKGAIFRPTGKDASFYVAASYGHTPEYDEYQKNLTFAPGRSGVVGRVLLDGKSIQIPDVLADPEYKFREIARLGDFRTNLGVPLIREGIPIGILVLQRAVVRPFNDKQIKLVETFADQAVIAIENTRLFEAEQQRTRELTESLEQQTATSEVLRVISSSPGELKPVFSAMLANATHLCEATFGNLLMGEGPIFRAVAVHSKQSFDDWRRNPVIDLRDNPGIPLDRLVNTKQVVHIADLRTDQSYIGKNDRIVSLVEVAGSRTFLAVPMVKEDELIGEIGLYRQEVRPFTDKQIELVKNFAAQAVIAIENTRLLNELRQRTTDLTERTAELTESLEQQTATAEVLKVISSSPGELKPVFEAMLEKAVHICDANFGMLFRVENGAVSLAAMFGVPPAFAEFWQRGPHRPGPRTAFGRMVETMQTVHIADVKVEPAYVEGEPVFVAAVNLGGFRTLIAVPMLRDNELMGLIGIYRQEVWPFTDKQI
jgi:GAF domain-containing protein